MDEYIGIIKIFAGTFTPRNYANCDGTLLSTAQNSALFSILGTQFGGDGTKNFALPDLRGRVPIGFGQQPGSASYVVGQTGGQESHTLLLAEMPTHQHLAYCSPNPGTLASPDGAVWAAGASPSRGTAPPNLYGTGATNAMSSTVAGYAGNSQPHENRQPYLAIRYIICIYGVFPSRN